MKKIILFIVMMLMAQSAWATFPNYTVMPSGGDFNTLEGAINDIASNHAVLATPVTITISGTWASADTTSVNITGITTTATNNISISTSGSSVYPGFWSDASPYYRLKVTNNDAMDISVDNVNVTGIQMNSICNTGFNARTLRINNNNITIDRVFAYGTGTNPDKTLFIPSGGPVTVMNTIVIMNTNGQDDATLDETNNNQGFFYNDDFISLDTSHHAFTAFNTTAIKNCYASSGASTAYNGGTLTTSASSDTSGSTGLQSIAYSTSSGAKFTNITSGSENFTLQSGSALIGVGTDLSATFTDDIIGVTRTVPWDIGAFKFVAAGPTSHFDLIQGGSVIRGGSLIN